MLQTSTVYPRQLSLAAVVHDLPPDLFLAVDTSARDAADPLSAVQRPNGPDAIVAPFALGHRVDGYDLAVFSSIPQGPGPDAMLRFLDSEGLAILEPLTRKLGFVAIPLISIPFKNGRWFRHELLAPGGFRNMRVRVDGLATRWFEAVGALPQAIPEAEIFSRRSQLDCAEGMDAALDLEIGMDRVFRYNYRPSLLQPALVIYLWIRSERFDAMEDVQQRRVREACRDTLTRWHRKLTDAQGAALKRMASTTIVREFAPSVQSWAKQVWERDVVPKLGAGTRDIIGRAAPLARNEQELTALTQPRYAPSFPYGWLFSLVLVAILVYVGARLLASSPSARAVLPTSPATPSTSFSKIK